MAEWCADVDADAPSLHGELRRLVLGACDLESTGDSAHQHAGIAQPAVRRLHSRAQIGLADSFELVTPLGADPMHVQRAARSGVKNFFPRLLITARRSRDAPSSPSVTARTRVAA